jgi:phosphoribosyl-AMP cyclohydrolase
MSETWVPDFAKRGGLVPAVVQDARTRDVLMLGWVNQEAWNKTLDTKKATFWSTSRNELWVKGATSGDELPVVEVRVDCDDDTVLYLVEPRGGTCHTTNARGETRKSCFYRRIETDRTLTNLDP